MNFDIKRRTNAIKTIFFNHVINHIIFKTVHTAMKTSAKKKNIEGNVCENFLTYLV